MIYITGDTHGEKIRFIENNMGDDNWTSEDCLIVCGDFGYVFKNNTAENEFLDELERTKPYTICFCDGNHENFDALYKYPEVEKFGNTVHKIRENIFHLERGRIYTIEGKTFFTFGGAYSIDKAWRVAYNPDRSEDKPVLWWPQEIPNDEEYHRAADALKAVNYKVDYIITHTAPKEIILKMGKYPDAHDMQLTGFLEWIMFKADFKHWYFGHWHISETFYDKYTAVYFDIQKIE